MQRTANHSPDAGGKPSNNLAQQLNSLFKRLKGGADDFYTKLHVLETCIVDVEGKSATFFAEVEEHPCVEKGRTMQVRYGRKNHSAPYHITVC